jgi:hypothetical protein
MLDAGQCLINRPSVQATEKIPAAAKARSIRGVFRHDFMPCYKTRQLCICKALPNPYSLPPFPLCSIVSIRVIDAAPRMIRSGARVPEEIYVQPPTTTERRREALSSMAANEILQEATNLHTVSKRLHTLAEENAPVTEALSTVATAVRQSATLLEVLVAIRMGQDKDVENASN